MTVKLCLKLARKAISEGVELYAAVARCAESGEEINGALAMIELVATPLNFALNAQVQLWERTQVDSDGLAAMSLAKLPGAQVTLLQWLEAPDRKIGHVLHVLNAAILKA